MDEASINAKTWRIVVLCLTTMVLGLFFFLFKIEACKTVPAPPTIETCREEFVEMRTGGYSTDHKCSPGATVEMISSPPAPKAGLFCRCPKYVGTPTPAVSNSAQ